MQTNPQRYANLFTFIKRILKGKLHFFMQSCYFAIEKFISQMPAKYL